MADYLRAFSLPVYEFTPAIRCKEIGDFHKVNRSDLYKMKRGKKFKKAHCRVKLKSFKTQRIRAYRYYVLSPWAIGSEPEGMIGAIAMPDWGACFQAPTRRRAVFIARIVRDLWRTENA